MATVEIYSTPTCTFCVQAKNFFHANGIDYIEYNVANDFVKRQEMIEKSGQMGVPVISVDDKVAVGFDEGLVRSMLGL